VGNAVKQIEEQKGKEEEQLKSRKTSLNDIHQLKCGTCALTLLTLASDSQQ